MCWRIAPGMLATTGNGEKFGSASDYHASLLFCRLTPEPGITPPSDPRLDRDHTCPRHRTAGKDVATWLSGYSVQPWHGATSANDSAGRCWGPKCKGAIIDRKPRRNLESLFAGVTQKTNAPYSQKDIEVSAEALRKAGGLPKVDVNVVPDVSRVRVNFLLEPGVVSYPGAEKQFLLIS